MARAFVIVLTLLIALAPAPVLAQPYPPPNAPPPASAAVFSPQQLDQMLAPIALYPDALLAQVLMAATYPLDVVAADRWLQQPTNARLRGNDLAAALDQQPWDPSVKSLVPFPQILQMMDSRLDWMQGLGDAFLAQSGDVMASVQRLRAAARAAGMLVSTPQQTVEVQDGTILIIPANPNVVYVPAYAPDLMYGTWPYPQYPPIYIPPPPGYTMSGLFFGVGIAVVVPLWGWNHFDWAHRRVNIDRDRFNRINRGRPPVTSDTWQHDPSRRGAVPYRDPATRAQYQRPLPGPAPDTRRDFRGYPPGQGPVTQPTPARAQAQPQVTRPTPPTGQAARPPQVTRPATPSPAQPQVARPATPPQVFRSAEPAPKSVFQPASPGPDARAYSQRGQQSRQTPVASAHAAPAMRAAPPPHGAPAAPARGAAPAARPMPPAGGAPGGTHR